MRPHRLAEGRPTPAVMCGRFVRFSSVERFGRWFGASGNPEVRPSFNIPPGAAILAARTASEGKRELVLFRWGLVPAWSDAARTPYSTINARAETVAEKPAYRSAFRHRRCLIAADGFFEWYPREDGHKQPYYIHLASDEPFAFAGIWEHWERGGQTLESCSILVTAANDLMEPIHDRMPVILPREHYDGWLDPDIVQPERLQPLLAAYPSPLMTMYPVDTLVNNPRNDGRDLLLPLA